MKLFLLAALWYTVSQNNTILEGVPMKAALDHFRNAIFSPGETAHISDTELQQSLTLSERRTVRSPVKASTGGLTPRRSGADAAPLRG